MLLVSGRSRCRLQRLKEAFRGTGDLPALTHPLLQTWCPSPGLLLLCLPPLTLCLSQGLLLHHFLSLPPLLLLHLLSGGAVTPGRAHRLQDLLYQRLIVSFFTASDFWWEMQWSELNSSHQTKKRMSFEGYPGAMMGCPARWRRWELFPQVCSFFCRWLTAWWSSLDDSCAPAPRSLASSSLDPPGGCPARPEWRQTLQIKTQGQHKNPKCCWSSLRILKSAQNQHLEQPSWMKPCGASHHLPPLLRQKAVSRVPSHWLCKICSSITSRFLTTEDFFCLFVCVGESVEDKTLVPARVRHQFLLQRLQLVLWHICKTRQVKKSEAESLKIENISYNLTTMISYFHISYIYQYWHITILQSSM